jgi:hypothetical protein
MPGMSGVQIRQINTEHEIRSLYSSDRSKRQDDKDCSTIEAAAKQVARTLAGENRAKRETKPVYRSADSKKTTDIGVYLVNERPTSNRARYYVDGKGRLYALGFLDTVLSLVVVSKLNRRDKANLADVLGTTLTPVD